MPQPGSPNNTGQRPQWAERDIALPRINVHARELDADGPLLVLLHGLSADGSVWQGVGRRLSPPYSLVAPDLRGHGLSGHPTSGYASADYAEDVAELLDALMRDDNRRGQQVHLLGHSLGAIAALGGAALRPGAVRKLVLVDPPLDGPHTLPSFLHRMLDARHRGDQDAVRALILEQTPGLSEPLLRVYERLWSRVADGALEAVIQDRPFDVARWYPRVYAPTLILRAGAGTVFGDATTRRVLRELPDARVITVEGAGHNIHAEKPAEFARLVLEFLRHPDGVPVRNVSPGAG